MPHRPDQGSKIRRWLQTGGVSAALIVVPLASGSDPFSVVWHTALAKSDGDHHRGRGQGADGASGLDRPVGDRAHRFSPEGTRQLIERGWRPARAAAAGFKHRGPSVRAMIKISKRPGHGARVGRIQANCGAPYEIGMAWRETDLAGACAEPEAGPEDSEAEARADSLVKP